MVRVKQKIMVPRGVVPKLCEEFKASQSTIFRALALDTNSAIADKIRDRALELGGIRSKGF